VADWKDLRIDDNVIFKRCFERAGVEAKISPELMTVGPRA